MYIPYNSRLEYHKSIFGAVKTDQTVTFRIILPRDFCCHAAKLVIKKAEADEYGYINMQWDCMEGVGEEWWKVDFTAEKAALYKYHFEYDTSWGTSRIYHAGNGLAAIKGDGEDWQLTIYDKDFHTPEWLRGGIIYQIFPDRFASSGTKKQNVPSDRVLRTDRDGDPYWIPTAEGKVLNNDYFGGDLKGIEEKLLYLANLGVTCIYLNPIFEANSNHRYDTADYEKIDPLLGTEDDLKSLCKTAREQYGISIILDGVFSHTGCDSKYFNIYSNYDDVGAYNSKESPYYPWYKFINWPDEYHSWWGIKLLPEVIEETPEYREYICGKNGILRKWLKCGISGWRLDVADELPDVFLDDLRRAVKDENSDAVIIGEVWEDATTKLAYGERRRYLLGEQLDSVMNYPFADAVLNFVKFANADAFIVSVMSIIEKYPPQVTNVLMNHIGTHDTERAITRLAGENCEGYGRHWQHEHNKLSDYDYYRGVSMMKIASLIQYTLPGVPSLYYGDEIGMQGMKDPFNRACMDWYEPNTELHRWYKRLGEIRRGCKAFERGSFVPIYCSYKTVAYLRSGDNNEVLVAVNLDENAVDINVGSQWDNAYYFFESTVQNGNLHLEPFRYTLLTRNF